MNNKKTILQKIIIVLCCVCVSILCCFSVKQKNEVGIIEPNVVYADNILSKWTKTFVANMIIWISQVQGWIYNVRGSLDPTGVVDEIGDKLDEFLLETNQTIDTWLEGQVVPTISNGIAKFSASLVNTVNVFLTWWQGKNAVANPENPTVIEVANNNVINLALNGFSGYVGYSGSSNSISSSYLTENNLKRTSDLFLNFDFNNISLQSYSSGGSYPSKVNYFITDLDNEKFNKLNKNVINYISFSNIKYGYSTGYYYSSNWYPCNYYINGSVSSSRTPQGSYYQSFTYYPSFDFSGSSKYGVTIYKDNIIVVMVRPFTDNNNNTKYLVSLGSMSAYRDYAYPSSYLSTYPNWAPLSLFDYSEDTIHNDMMVQTQELNDISENLEVLTNAITINQASELAVLNDLKTEIINTANNPAWYETILNPVKGALTTFFDGTNVNALEGVITANIANIESHTGILSYPLVFVTGFLNDVINYEPSDFIISMPNVEIFDAELFNDEQQINFTELVEENETFSYLYHIMQLIFEVLIILGLINMCKDKIDEIAKGK